jgi:hypothetical protein
MGWLENCTHQLTVRPSSKYLGRIAMKLSKIPSPIGLLAACLLAACGSSSQPPAADASPDLKDAAGEPSSDVVNVVDSATADARDLAVSDAAPPIETSPIDTLRPVLDVAGVDTAEGSNLDAQAVDLPATDVLAAEAGGEASSEFACSSLGTEPADVSQRACYDFSNPSQSGSFTPEAGTWSVVAGSYRGIGPADGQITCPGGAYAGTAMTTAVLNTPSAANVRVHARMTSITRPDKVLVLRAQPSGDRIELNFRSYFAMDGRQQGGDLVISTLSACNQTILVLPDAVPVPQYSFKPVVVDVKLIGQKLTVVVDGNQIYDDAPMATSVDGGTQQLLSAPGRVGFGVFYDGEVTFDDLVVEVLK